MVDLNDVFDRTRGNACGANKDVKLGDNNDENDDYESGGGGGGTSDALLVAVAAEIKPNNRESNQIASTTKNNSIHNIISDDCDSLSTISPTDVAVAAADIDVSIVSGIDTGVDVDIDVGIDIGVVVGDISNSVGSITTSSVGEVRLTNDDDRDVDDESPSYRKTSNYKISNVTALGDPMVSPTYKMNGKLMSGAKPGIPYLFYVNRKFLTAFLCKVFYF